MPEPALILLFALLLALLGAVLFWPGRGLLPRLQETRRLTSRVLSEDALKHIHTCETAGRTPSIESIAGNLSISANRTADILTRLETSGLILTRYGEIELTPAGREVALRIIRAHRLWERYLADQTGFDASEWHTLAERFEHDLSPEETEALAARLGHPTHDPHGDPIPSREGHIPPADEIPLPQLEIGRPARIAHLEDEPHLIFDQLVAEGLYPGMDLRVVESTSQRVRFWSNGSEHVLAPLLANNVGVVPLEQPETRTRGIPLDSLPTGETAAIIHISRAVQGAERRRLFDLGLLPGTKITPEFRSLGKDPTAYRVRGALIALRAAQAKAIKVERNAPHDE